MDKVAYDNAIKEIDQLLGDILDEYGEARALLENNRRFIRTRLLLAFSMSEVISIVYDKYYNLNLPNSDLLKKWWNEYCLTDENIVHKKHRYLKLVSADRMYRFRNSIVHAFTLPEMEANIGVIIANGSEEAPNIKIIAGRFARAGQRVIFISPDSLTALFTAGAKLTIEKMFPPFEKATEVDFLAVARTQKEFQRRSARAIPIEE